MSDWIVRTVTCPDCGKKEKLGGSYGYTTPRQLAEIFHELSIQASEWKCTDCKEVEE